MPYVTLRSECGIPNVPSLESMKKFLPKEKLWPINESWALHDWTYHMNGPANTFMDALQLYKPGDLPSPLTTCAVRSRIRRIPSLFNTRRT